MLILGIGNLLMGDEGVGVHAVRALEGLTMPPGITVLDGGTGGFHLLELFDRHRHMILIDATLDDRAPGTVRVLRPKFASDFPRSLSAHDIGLRDLIESAALLGPLPTMDLITISIAKIQPMSIEMTPEVRDAIPQVIRTVGALARDRLLADALAGVPAA
ncbi:MAG TPA: hydrogenase maturation protease [Vicinamibacteria bacterium]|nr:hydrogenase maturation protease [Vicinamibacteria bacterium]HRB12951.1 hydrogenase maturation protease [Vicinamibacteria bacterium]